jgi:hypothetical protein
MCHLAMLELGAKTAPTQQRLAQVYNIDRYAPTR